MFIVPRNVCDDDFNDSRLVNFLASILYQERRDRLPACLPSRPRLSPTSLVSPNNEYDTTWLLDEMCVPDGCCVERNAARSTSPRREDGAKTSFVRLFRGKVFRDESTRFAHTNERTNERHSLVDSGLHFSSEMLLKLPYNQERFHCAFRKCRFTIGMQSVAHKQTVLVRKSSRIVFSEKNILRASHAIKEKKIQTNVSIQITMTFLNKKNIYI